MSAQQLDMDVTRLLNVPRPVKLMPKADAITLDIENIIFQALVNEGKHLKVLNTRKQPLTYNEKELREAAHAEVAVMNSSQFDSDKNSKKRKTLDTDEKAKQSRDRNREHAKFTRLRKKAYVGKLKDLLDEMKKITDAEEADRRSLGEKIHQTQIARKQAVRLFLDYRAVGMRQRELWASLLDDNVVMTLPITPYRSFHRSNIVNSSRVVRGVDGVMADAASLSLLAECIGQTSAKWKSAIKRNAACKIEYVTRPDDILAAGDTVMCRYTLQIRHCDTVGGAGSCVQHGMMQCKFDRLNKITAVEFTFDVMGFMQQLQMCWGISPENSIVPNTVEAAMQPSKEPCAVLSAAHPHELVHANDSLKALAGMSKESVEKRVDGTLLTLLRVYDFQHDLISKLAAECACGVPGSAIFLSHNWREMDTINKSLNDLGYSTVPPLVYYVKMLPLTSDCDDVSHIYASLVELPLTEEEGRAAVEKARLVSLAMRVVVAPNVPGTNTSSVSSAGSAGSSASAPPGSRAGPSRSSGENRPPSAPPALSGVSVGPNSVPVPVLHHQAQQQQNQRILHPHPAANINPQPFYYYPQNALLSQQQPAPVAIFPGMFTHFPAPDVSVHPAFPAGPGGYAPGMYLSAEALRRAPVQPSSNNANAGAHMPQNVANNGAQQQQMQHHGQLQAQHHLQRQAQAQQQYQLAQLQMQRQQQQGQYQQGQQHQAQQQYQGQQHQPQYQHAQQQQQPQMQGQPQQQHMHQQGQYHQQQQQQQQQHQQDPPKPQQTGQRSNKQQRM